MQFRCFLPPELIEGAADFLSVATHVSRCPLSRESQEDGLSGCWPDAPEFTAPQPQLAPLALQRPGPWAQLGTYRGLSHKAPGLGPAGLPPGLCLPSEDWGGGGSSDPKVPCLNPGRAGTRRHMVGALVEMRGSLLRCLLLLR